MDKKEMIAWIGTLPAQMQPKWNVQKANKEMLAGFIETAKKAGYL